jgi:hypothetical protein
VKHANPNRLVFHDRVIPFVGTVLLVGGLAGTIGLGGDARFHCDREQGQCAIERSRGLGLFASSDVIPLAEIRHARLDRRTRRDSGTTRMYRAMLVTTSGSKQLSHTESGGLISHQALVNEVNAFLQDPGQPTLDAADDSAGGGAGLVAWGMLAIGVYVLFGVRSVAEVTANFPAGDLVLTRRRWWQRSGERQVLRLDEIAGIEVKTSASKSSDRRGSSNPTRSVVFRLTSGEVVPLFRFETTGSGASSRRDRLEDLLRAGRRT